MFLSVFFLHLFYTSFYTRDFRYFIIWKPPIFFSIILVIFAMGKWRFIGHTILTAVTECNLVIITLGKGGLLGFQRAPQFSFFFAYLSTNWYDIHVHVDLHICHLGFFGEKIGIKLCRFRCVQYILKIWYVSFKHTQWHAHAHQTMEVLCYFVKCSYARSKETRRYFFLNLIICKCRWPIILNGEFYRCTT